MDILVLVTGQFNDRQLRVQISGLNAVSAPAGLHPEPDCSTTSATGLLGRVANDLFTPLKKQKPTSVSAVV